MLNFKSQISSSKQISNLKLHTLNNCIDLIFKPWNLFGIWHLNFGILSDCKELGRAS
jgi:hypothetical protein